METKQARHGGFEAEIVERDDQARVGRAFRHGGAEAVALTGEILEEARGAGAEVRLRRGGIAGEGDARLDAERADEVAKRLDEVEPGGARAEWR